MEEDMKEFIEEQKKTQTSSDQDFGEDEELINTAKEFYENRDNIEFDTSDENWKKDVVDENQDT